ncbi:MAG TPA: NAD-binding protein [Tepidisphaeraceae bacterium]|nr:NAD-binding protein [Tepidisphaeraceae bacterium]
MSNELRPISRQRVNVESILARLSSRSTLTWTLALGISTFVFGTFGFALHSPVTELGHGFDVIRYSSVWWPSGPPTPEARLSEELYPDRTVLTCVYMTAQLFLLNSGDVEGKVPWPLEFARVLAVLTTTSFLTYIFQMLRETLRVVRTPRTVVIGLGQRGGAIADTVAPIQRPVVGIDCDEENAALWRKLGFTVIHGDAGDKRVLYRARITPKANVLITAGLDATNVRVLLQLLAMHPKTQTFVHIKSPAIMRLLDGIADNAPVRPIIFNTTTLATRDLFSMYPLDFVPGEVNGIRADDSRFVHLILIGFSAMGQSIALGAMRLGHFANQKRVRITLIDPNASQLLDKFRAGHPNVDLIADIHAINQSPDSTDARRQIKTSSISNDEITHVYVCVDEDTHAVEIAQTLPLELPTRVPVYVLIDEGTGLRELLTKLAQDQERYRHLRPFGLIPIELRPDKLLNQERDRLAEAIHNDYVTRNPTSGERPWLKLPEELRHANREQADHLTVKLRTLGLKLEPSKSPDTIAFDAVLNDPRLLEQLARVEHHRWNASRWLAGYRYGEKQDLIARTHPCLVEWEKLSEADKKKDFDTIHNIPALARKIGCSIVRDTSN